MTLRDLNARLARASGSGCRSRARSTARRSAASSRPTTPGRSRHRIGTPRDLRDRHHAGADRRPPGQGRRHRGQERRRLRPGQAGERLARHAGRHRRRRRSSWCRCRRRRRRCVALYDGRGGAGARRAPRWRASQLEPAAFDVRVEDGGHAVPAEAAVRFASSPAATATRRSPRARALRVGRTADGADAAAPSSERRGRRRLDAPWQGDATVRFSWLPSRLPQVLALARRAAAQRRCRRRRSPAASRRRRAAAARRATLAALAPAVERLRASADVGNVVVLRGTARAEGARRRVGAAARSSDRRRCAALKHDRSIPAGHPRTPDRGPDRDREPVTGPSEPIEPMNPSNPWLDRRSDGARRPADRAASTRASTAGSACRRVRPTCCGARRWTRRAAASI